MKQLDFLKQFYLLIIYFNILPTFLSHITNTIISLLVVVKDILHGSSDEVAKENNSPQLLSIIAVLVEPRLVLV